MTVQFQTSGVWKWEFDKDIRFSALKSIFSLSLGDRASFTGLNESLEFMYCTVKNIYSTPPPLIKYKKCLRRIFLICAAEIFIFWCWLFISVAWGAKPTFRGKIKIAATFQSLLEAHSRYGNLGVGQVWGENQIYDFPFYTFSPSNVHRIFITK